MKSRLLRNEHGQALILALILLGVGSLIVVPLLGFMSTGLVAGQVIDRKMYELYAADAGIEDAAHKILTNYGSFASLKKNGSYTYSLTNQVNGLPVSVTVTKLSLIANFLSDDEYKVGQPHEDWVSFSAPAETDRTAQYVEYSCTITFNYNVPQGSSPRQIITIGAFFTSYPGSLSLIEGPYDIDYAPVIGSAFLEAGSPETAVGSGSFAFIWRWQKTPPKGPVFNPGNTGALSFKFKIWDPSWIYKYYFIWATFRQQDISYVTNCPGIYNWKVEATAGDTQVRSYILGGTGQAGILSWEINP